MIKVSVESYCHNCSDFIPKTEKTGYYNGDNIEKHDTIIYCEQKDRCHSIVKYIKMKQEKWGTK